jgi:biotin operon repressor
VSAPLIFVRDGRTLPFIPVSIAALRRIRASCEKRVYATATYMALLELANEDRTDRIAITQKLLADRVGAGRTTVQAAITDLEQAGLLQITERNHGGQRLENEYIVVEPDDESDTPARHTSKGRSRHGRPSPATRAATPRRGRRGRRG